MTNPNSFSWDGVMAELTKRERKGREKKLRKLFSLGFPWNCPFVFTKWKLQEFISAVHPPLLCAGRKQQRG